MDHALQRLPFPRTTVAGVSLPRLLIGTNWLLGYSHTGPAADGMIQDRHSTRESISQVLLAYLEYGIDALMAPIRAKPILLEAVRAAEDASGSRITLIDTPIINVDNNAKARREANDVIRKSKELGATFCLIHHASCEQLVDRNRQKIPRLNDYLSMIRDAGMIPGLSAHMPEIVLFSDQNGYDVETYIQIYNCSGFLMQVEVEQAARIIQEAKKPVMTIKSLAAGRVTPYVGLTFSFATLRDCDMVTLGAFTPSEVHEDVEIAQAALARRFPDIGMRDSPAKTQAVLNGG